MGGDWLISTDNRWKSASDRDLRVLALARRQKHLVTRSQLFEAGFSPGAIQHRLGAYRWFGVHAGVYSLIPPPLTDDARAMAAVLACGDGTAVSGLASAWLFGLRPELPRILDVTNVAGRGRSRAGIRVHRRRLDAVDFTRRRGIPSVTATRAVADLSAILGSSELEQLLILADSRRLIDPHRLGAIAVGERGRGHRALREALGLGTPHVRSPIEALYVRICSELDVDAPLVNATIEVLGRRFEVDFHWPRLRLIVEVDGYAFHGGRSRANSDRDREQLLSMAGWLVHRFTRDQIVGNPGEVARRTLHLYRRRQKSAADFHR
jgi:Protein of unknown function (DUF559)